MQKEIKWLSCGEIRVDWVEPVYGESSKLEEIQFIK